MMDGFREYCKNCTNILYDNDGDCCKECQCELCGCEYVEEDE